RIITTAANLKTFQEEDDDEKIEVLPKILLADVPKKGRSFELTRTVRKNLEIFHHSAFTNHIVYTDIVFPLADLQEDELWIARLLTQLIPQVGSGERNFVDNLNYIQAHTGGIDCNFSFNHQVYDSTQITPSLHIKSTALYHKASNMFRLLFDTVYALNLTEADRIKELIIKHYTNLESSLAQNGLKYAVNLSASAVNQANYVANKWYGLDYFYKIKDVAHNFDTKGATLIDALQKMQQKLLCREGAHLVVTCDQTEFSKFLETGFDGLIDLPLKPFTSWKSNFTLPKVQPQARIISSPVSFTARAFQALSYAHPDAAYVSLAANIFDNQTLHKRIREQGGAYGGGTSYNPTSGNFYFYSFRDPHIASTVEAFKEAMKAALSNDIDESELEEAKLEMIQTLDAPVPPGDRGEVAYSRYREGKTEETRQAFREKLLAATQEDVKRAIENYIIPAYKESILVSFAGRELIEKENKKIHPKLLVEKV
ncbi:MAG: Metalloprotease, partial [Chlamydiia bacterium]|nr:Metalloprotease [Chlamydiia bacterium]